MGNIISPGAFPNGSSSGPRRSKLPRLDIFLVQRDKATSGCSTTQNSSISSPNFPVNAILSHHTRKFSNMGTLVDDEAQASLAEVFEGSDPAAARRTAVALVVFPQASLAVLQAQVTMSEISNVEQILRA